MPFEPGHKYYPPANGIVKGMSAASAKHKRDLALEVRENVPASAIVEYWLLIAMGKPGVHLERNEDGDVIATWEDGGIVPSDERKDAAMRWLADRGHGLPAQAIHLEGHLRAHATGIGATLDISALGAGALAGIRELVRRGGGALPAPPVDAIDAEFTEVPATASADGSPDPGAPVAPTGERAQGTPQGTPPQAAGELELERNAGAWVASATGSTGQ